MSDPSTPDEAGDPFAEFAKELRMTGETVAKVKEEEPSMPTASTPFPDVIDGYGKFMEYVQQRKAAEKAYIDARRKVFDSRISDELDNLGYVDSFHSSAPIVSSPVTLHGGAYNLNIDYAHSTVFDQGKLRALDLGASMSAVSSGIIYGGATLPPPTGLSVTYKAEPDKATDLGIKSDLDMAVTEYKAKRKYTTTRR
jgi:hypothetical protein